MSRCSNHLATGPSGNKINCFPLEQLLDVYMVILDKRTVNKPGISRKELLEHHLPIERVDNEGYEVMPFTWV